MTTSFAPDRLDQPLYGARFGQAVRRYLRKYATFSGRASRSEYWWSLLFLNLVVLVAMIPYVVTVVGTMVSLTATLATASTTSTPDVTGIGFWTVGMMASLIPVFVVSLATIVPTLALQARRHHDVGMSAWMLLLAYPTGGIWTYVIGFLGPKLEGLRYEVPGTQQPVVAPELAPMAAYGMPFGAPVGFPPHAQPGHPPYGAQPGFPPYGAQPGAAPQPGPYGQHPHG